MKLPLTLVFASLAVSIVSVLREEERSTLATETMRFVATHPFVGGRN